MRLEPESVAVRAGWFLVRALRDDGSAATATPKEKKAANPQAKNKKQTENMKNGFTERQREEEGNRKMMVAAISGWCCSFLFAFSPLVIALAAFLCGRGLQLFVLFS